MHKWTYTNCQTNEKNQIKFLPCSDVADLNNYKIVETDASEIGYGGIIKQKKNNTE